MLGKGCRGVLPVLHRGRGGARWSGHLSGLRSRDVHRARGAHLPCAATHGGDVERLRRTRARAPSMHPVRAATGQGQRCSAHTSPPGGTVDRSGARRRRGRCSRRGALAPPAGCRSAQSSQRPVARLACEAVRSTPSPTRIATSANSLLARLCTSPFAVRGNGRGESHGDVRASPSNSSVAAIGSPRRAVSPTATHSRPELTRSARARLLARPNRPTREARGSSGPGARRRVGR
jgi:hypothetical protein